jgi:hypothetical protein
MFSSNPSQKFLLGSQLTMVTMVMSGNTITEASSTQGLALMITTMMS